MATRAPVEGVIFDWGGTLSRWATVDLLDMWRLAAEHLDPERADEVAAHLLAVEDEVWAATTSSMRSCTLAEILQRASNELQLDVSEAVLEEAALHHIDAWTPHVEHKADAAPTLRALRQRGLRTGLLSNTHWPRRVHRHFLERDGLAELLDAEVYSSELAVVKPHPDAFRAALDAVGIEDPSRAVFVGDRPHDDVFGASQVGMRTVFLPTSDVPYFEGAEPDAVIHELSELVTVIDGWRAA